MPARSNLAWFGALLLAKRDMEIGECRVSCVMLRHYVGATLHYYVGVCGPVNTRTLYICLGLSNLDFPTPRRDGEIAKPCDARTGKRGGAAKRTILLCMCIDHGKEGLTASSLNAFAVKSRRQEDSISYNCFARSRQMSQNRNMMLLISKR